MTWMSRTAVGLALLLTTTLSVRAQNTDSATAEESAPYGSTEGRFAAETPRVFGLEAESLPAELAEDLLQVRPEPAWGPTPVSDVRFLMDDLGLARTLDNRGIRAFGWFENGYTYASGGPGELSVQTRQNRFGDEYLVNQIGLVVQKPHSQDEFDIGWNVRYFAGADAALGQPLGGIGGNTDNPRFSQDFRDLNVTAHVPILTEGGMNVKFGRMNSIIGYNGFLAPYRPLYSSDYQFFYSQDGAFTGFLTQLVVSDRLDIWNGMTLGANTFFEKRSENSYCYIGQVNYWLTDAQRTRLTASLHCGPDAIFAAPGLGGDFDTIVELRLQHAWSERLTQVVQSNMGWDTNTPVGTGAWYGLYNIYIYHMTQDWDVINRVDWFDDVDGTRTGFATNYFEATLGLNWHPNKFLEVRPEVRGDFAQVAAFGSADNPQDKNQLTTAVSALVKF